MHSLMTQASPPSTVLLCLDVAGHVVVEAGLMLVVELPVLHLPPVLRYRAELGPLVLLVEALERRKKIGDARRGEKML